MKRSVFLLLCGLLVSTNACAAKDARSDASFSAPQVVRVSPHAIACRGYQDPSKIGPPSYAVADIGKSDVPKLSTDQRALLARVKRYVSSAALRFAFLPSRPRGGPFIIFDAKEGPCIDAAGGYQVLNGVNEYYDPGENPFITTAGAATMPATPGPWMTASPHPKSSSKGFNTSFKRE